MKAKDWLGKITFRGLLAVAITMAFAARAFCGEPGWTTDYAKAVAQAKSENKAILLDFTGSDWCGWCMKMKEETLDKPMFKHYAEKNLVLVEVDFPRSKPQSDEVKAQNTSLSQKYKIGGYPAFIILNNKEEELGRQLGYLAGGPSAFLAKLNTFYKPAASSSGSDDFDSFFKKPTGSPTP